MLLHKFFSLFDLDQRATCGFDQKSKSNDSSFHMEEDFGLFLSDLDHFGSTTVAPPFRGMGSNWT